MAHELGLFARQNLRVELSREIGWATVRDKIIMRELDAAHAPAPMVLAISSGIGSFKVPCTTGLVLNLHGNGITLSNRLWTEGVRDGKTLGDYVRSREQDRPLTLGVAFSCSSHNSLLNRWLKNAGLAPDRHVNIVVVPPPQMAANLKAGNLDGYCVGEPWNSLAVARRAGWVVALSCEIDPGHPEKVLLVRTEFASTRSEEHERLITALLEACEFCQLPQNRRRVAEILAAPKYLNVNADIIHSSLCGVMSVRKAAPKSISDLHVFAGTEVNEPTLQKAAWARQSLVDSGLLPNNQSLDRQQLSSIFRSDLFQAIAAKRAQEIVCS